MVIGNILIINIYYYKKKINIDIYNILEEYIYYDYTSNYKYYKKFIKSTIYENKNKLIDRRNLA